MKAAEAIVRCLEAEGTKLVFGYPGATVIPIYEVLRTSNITHILSRHEQAVGHSANGYARATGKAAVCFATSGPGATNIITSIATAYMDSIPLVVITGQVKLSNVGKDVFQEADIIGSTECFTKYSYLVKDGKTLPKIIKEAFHIAGSGRPGPVLIDVPLDIQNDEIGEFDYESIKVDIRGYKPTYKGHKGQIKKVIDKLKVSKKPILCIGGGVKLSDAKEEANLLSQKAKIPVVYTMMGKDSVFENSPYVIGQIGSHGKEVANKAINEADLILFVGTRIADRSMSKCSGIEDNATIIHIDIDPAEIGKNIRSSIPVVGDCKNILSEILEQIDELNTDSWINSLTLEKRSLSLSSKLSDEFVNAKHVIKKLSDVASDDAILITDVGQNQIWSALNFEIRGKRRFLTSGGLGTMGYSLPTAVGARFGADKDTQILAVMGDGGFQMSMFELGTIMEHNLNLKLVLLNNDGLGMVREMQNNMYKNPFGTLFAKSPDFIKLSEAYGIKCKRVCENSDVESALKEALEYEGPYLLEFIVDPSEATL
ncbi:biosynthetic-type acetolactate synthase large subunit [Clostridium cylindrosporum]|uniref:Acetolactate synthase n=1 Tax=Clostridium cylindrosporum DSM 605 TaxID=1121307 RepID=A0A0J8DA69_CLOCY|nr:biosynthetic-type acetolactate synthase large subunit [Clostridium cylindrosporum]KMT21198.1 putative acetolactate synthase large subunit [Clostridium cylindrosporum DSM 605]